VARLQELLATGPFARAAAPGLEPVPPLSPSP